MKLGIRAHDVGKHKANELANIISQYQFESIQLVLNKAIDEDIFELIVDDNKLITISKAFQNQDVKVAMMGAYFNPIHSNQEKVEKAMTYFKQHLRCCTLFNTKYVGTETGSYNDDHWTFHEKNSSEEAFQTVVRRFAELLETAQLNQTYLAIEPAAHHVISSPKRLARLIDALNHPNIVVIFDLYNLLSIDNYLNQEQIIDEMVMLFKEKIKIIHLKDFIVTDHQLKQVSLGEGMLNFQYLFKKLKELNEEPTFIFEGVTEPHIQNSLNFINTLNP